MLCTLENQHDLEGWVRVLILTRGKSQRVPDGDS